jgi:hypothetical protein
MGQVVYGSSRFLQRFNGVLELGMECFRQAVVTLAILEHRSNLFVCRPSGDAM